MLAYFSLPLTILSFWFYEAPLSVLLYFLSLNRAVLELFSLPLLLRTFFQPIKGEYRKGLVGFSIGMGIVVKSWFIFIALIVLLFLIAFEVLFLLVFFTWPFLTLFLLIK